MSKQAAALQNAKWLTGNKQINIQQLTDSDKKVLSVIGYNYVECTLYSDSWP